MEKNFIKTEQKDNIFYIYLNRPEKRNAITFEMLATLGEAMEEVTTLSGIRGIIVTGAGKMFSAGIDFMSAAQLFQGSGDNTALLTHFRVFIRKAQNVLNLFEDIEIPVIAAVNRFAVGLGLEVALACDLRVASEDVEMGLPEPRLGLVADVGGTTRLSRLIGASRAKELIFTARNVPAQEALSIGLVNKIAPQEKLITEAENLIHKIAKQAPLAVGLTKRIINHGDGLTKLSQMELEVLAQSVLLKTEDMVEGATAAMEKREPKFKGR